MGEIRRRELQPGIYTQDDDQKRIPYQYSQCHRIAENATFVLLKLLQSQDHYEVQLVRSNWLYPDYGERDQGTIFQ